MRRNASSDCDPLCCSFCQKSQKEGRKLISSPSDYPRAYICDECVEICAMIIEDDRPDAESPSQRVPEVGQPHPLLSHPHASELMECVVQWVGQDALNPPAYEELDRLRTVARQIVRNDKQR